MRLQRIGLLLLPLFAASALTPVPLTFPTLFATQKAMGQTPNDHNLDQNPAANASVTGSFVDYFAEEAQLKGHEGSVNSASFTPDGKLVVTAGTDGTARVWDTSGKQVVELRGHSASVRSASFSPNGKRIVTASFDGTASVWDLSGNQLVKLTGHEGYVYSASFSPDGELIVTAGADKTVRVWDASGKQLVEIKGHSGSVYSASFSPDGKRIVTASADKTARVWDLSGKQLAELTGHTDTVWNASFSLDGQRIVTASDDKTARVWDLSGKLLAELKGHQKTVNSASFSPDGKLIVTASDDKTVRVWDTSGKLLAELRGHQATVNSASFSPDGQQIVTASDDYTSRVWYISDKLFAKFKFLENTYSSGRGENQQLWLRNDRISNINSASFSPDGKSIVTASEGNIARVWDTNGKVLVELKGHLSDINSASFSPDGKLIFTTSDRARIWDTSGNILAEFRQQPYVESGSFSPDSKLIVTASLDAARLWNTSGKLLAEFKGHDKPVTSASFSPDSKLIVTASEDNTALVWDINGNLIVELKGHEFYVNSASFSPDSKLIVTASFDKTARVWNTNGKQLTILLGHQGVVSSASFSPDSKLIVTASEDNTARLWDTSGKLLAELKGHQDIVTSANFSPDSKLIVTSSDDGTARVWHISGKLLAELKGHQGKLNSASFSPDGKRIVTASDDGTARVWNLSGKLLATLSLAAPPSSPKAEADRLRDLEFYAPNCADAFQPWQQALNIYREIGDKENEAYILEKLGNAYYCLSDYTQAIESYSQASEIAKEFNYLERQVKNLSKLGNVYNSLADYDKAIQYYNDALKTLDQNQDLKSQADVLRGRGNAYNSQGKSNEAIKDYLQALAIDESQKNGIGIAEDKVNLARIYQSLGDYNKAIQYYKEAEEFSPIEALAGLGNTYLALGDTAKAIDLHNQSLAKARQQEDKEGEANALNNLAYTLRQAGKFTEAEQYLREAIEIWENLRIKLDDANKVSIFEKQARTYRLLQEVLIAQNKTNEALEIAERGRARAFVELLASRISPNPKEQPSITPPNIERIKQIAKAQNATLVEYSIITDTFKVQGKEQTKESELYIWVIKPTGEITFRRSDLKPLWQKENLTLANLVTISRETIGVRSLIVVERQDAPSSQDQLKRLHELLIKPIADLLPTQENDRVIFIPQTSLFLVPFPALQDETGKYLIEKHPILTAPSIQVLELTNQQRQRVATPGKNALVVGNPTMPKVAPAIGKPPEQLSPLPGAEAEAKAIAPLLNTQALTGNQATKSSILPLMSKARIIHLATHGILDDIQGLKSAIALAPSDEDDGLLTAEEILNLKPGFLTKLGKKGVKNCQNIDWISIPAVQAHDPDINRLYPRTVPI